MRGIARVALMGAWVVSGALAVAFFVAQARPESPLPAVAGIAPPTAVALDRSARETIELGIATLSDASLDGSARLSAYRRAMERAEALLLRSLRANPVQPAAWARLAAIRWEQETPSTPEETDGILRLIDHASSMAGRIPEVQVQLGGLLLRMGRTAEALPYFRRAVALDPRVADDAVAALAASLPDPDAVAEALPDVPEVLVALRAPYAEAGRTADFLERMERGLRRANGAVIRVYVDTAITAKASARARSTLDALPAFATSEIEATRLSQLSRAARADGDPEAAVALARRAAALAPDDPYVAQGEGLALLAAGDQAAASAALRRALSVAARGGASRRFRASLYADLGRADEAAGRPDRAYDHYRRALELDPEADFPRRRMEAMRRSAGAR